ETHTAILCNGGTSTVTVVGAGGTSPYTGTGTFTQSAGSTTYTVTDANGCTATATAVITEPTLLTASETHTAIACFGGTSTVTVVGAGGTSPYTGDGAFTQSAGTVTYTVTDANESGATTTGEIAETAVLTAS